MAVVEKSVLIEHTAAQIFEVIDDVEHYPQFLPWCSDVDVHEKTERQTAARLHVNYHGIKAHFSTVNPKEFPRLMTIHLRDGPFRHLDGHWRLTPLGETACKIEFRLHYEFSSKLLEKAVGPVFNHIANTLLESFVKRANQVYG
ncbi:Ribosome association toxin RatA [Georgfuchsia toluolica]|uniref:Ribosome association toxin RatA n=1 Tax=Georgfuchsia toluolica TaxID=424218 RepID=A0A916J3K1_9PROT|nr:type II toxin-antitoxin system RatA family toxin [Georgfuchsia toluolica]CAG4883321.1 Ribosome association toxin RatA [Georgfuchsia toluolica]